MFTFFESLKFSNEQVFEAMSGGNEKRNNGGSENDEFKRMRQKKMEF